MSALSNDSKDKEKKRDPDFVNAEIAIKRAAIKAREKAKRRGSGVMIWKDGRVVEDRQDSVD